jgi:hypothetical protein
MSTKTLLAGKGGVVTGLNQEAVKNQRGYQEVERGSGMSPMRITVNSEGS